MQANRRRDPRAQVSKLAILERPDAPTSTAILEDVSESGARLKAAHAPHPHTSYVIHFRLGERTFMTPLRVASWKACLGGYSWHCELRGLSGSQREHIRHFVHRSAGLPIVRSWLDIRRDCSKAPGEQVVVAYRPDGGEIRLHSQQCLKIGPDRLDEFAQHVFELR